jgi:DNA repair protein RadA/Sms
MAKAQPRYVCQNCGASQSKWSGRCESCGAWNSITEEASREAAPGGLGVGGGRGGKAIRFERLADESAHEAPRHVTGIAEFDRVTGGGLVPASALLIGGDPGIGKSTLLLQASAALAKAGRGRVAYVSGEESIDQVRLRARRMGLGEAEVDLAAATSVRDIIASLEKGQPLSASPTIVEKDGRSPLAAVIIDSIQTMYVDTLDSAPGTVAQVRSSAAELIRLAKQRGFALLLVGHVTKEGMIAGPRVLEHMVDTVLYFEGERGHHYRILRAVKNRFGPANEIGVFEMTDRGLTEVANPSRLFLAERHGQVSGTAVFAGLEGTRPLLVEIQALVGPPGPATPRRAAVGWDGNRLAMVLAVLEARCGVAFGGRDVYLNVAGGLKIAEPAADLAVAAALVSALADAVVPEDMVVFGEIGLGGEVRRVSQPELRLREAAKLGFAKALLPAQGKGAKGTPKSIGIETREIAHLHELVAMLAADGQKRKKG